MRVPTFRRPTMVGVHKARRNTDHRRFINSRPWRKCAASYLTRHPYCVRCLRDRDEMVPATQVHHTRGDDPEHYFDEDTFEGLCASCHSRQTMGDMHARQAVQLEDNA